jgi:hypothetical protein
MDGRIILKFIINTFDNTEWMLTALDPEMVSYIHDNVSFGPIRGGER